MIQETEQASVSRIDADTTQHHGCRESHPFHSELLLVICILDERESLLLGCSPVGTQRSYLLTLTLQVTLLVFSAVNESKTLPKGREDESSIETGAHEVVVGIIWSDKLSAERS